MRGAVIAFAAALFAAVLAPSVSAQELAQNETLLEVVSTGQSRAIPDRATISGGVMTTATTTREAVAANGVAMQSLIAALRRSGVAERDIQSSRVGLTPTYARLPNGIADQARIVSHQASNQVLVTIHEVERAGGVLGAVFDSGATNASGPGFSLVNNAAALSAARTDAIARARADAETYAAGFGLRVGRIIRISERGQSARYQQNYARYSGDNIVSSRIPAASLVSPVATATATSSIPGMFGGMIVQSVTLWVDFALVPR